MAMGVVTRIEDLRTVRLSHVAIAVAFDTDGWVSGIVLINVYINVF